MSTNPFPSTVPEVDTKIRFSVASLHDAALPDVIDAKILARQWYSYEKIARCRLSSGGKIELGAEGWIWLDEMGRERKITSIEILQP
jgi:hypothetical protein